jgi:hypothetical protein
VVIDYQDTHQGGRSLARFTQIGGVLFHCNSGFKARGKLLYHGLQDSR